MFCGGGVAGSRIGSFSLVGVEVAIEMSECPLLLNREFE